LNVGAAILVLDSAVFLVMCIAFPAEPGVNPLLGPTIPGLITFGAKDTRRIQQGEWWRLVTPIFLHGGLLHLLLNALLKVRLLHILQSKWGAKRVLIVYLSGGFVGQLCSTVLSPRRLGVGSSGAAFGVATSMVPFTWEHWDELARPGELVAWVCIFTWMEVMIAAALPDLPIDNVAHMGGALGGMLVSYAVMPTMPLESEQLQVLIRVFCGTWTALCSVAMLVFIYR
jgi:membrane associated rhomboid family serine protease